jgi:hypothetical protein
MVNAMKSRLYKINVEEAAILSLVVSFTLVLLTILGWALWGALSQLTNRMLFD